MQQNFESCSCAENFAKNHDFISEKESCADVNECFGILNNCHENAFCTNSEASFNCQCNIGYEGDGVTCDDIDECLQDGICPEHAVCENFGARQQPAERRVECPWHRKTIKNTITIK